MQTQLTLLPVDFPANLSVIQESNLAKTIIDGSLMKCLGQYERLNRSGLWQKMFLQSLHQNLQKHSSIYVHQWKLKGTKYNRLLFQLRRLKPSMKGTEFGLLPTPAASDFRDRGNYWDNCNQRRLEIGKQVGLSTLFKGTPCPSCVNHMMGFPENWLNEPFMQQETQ